MPKQREQPKPGQEDLYIQLNTERVIIKDPNTGDVKRREAWERIDRLLECLHALNSMEHQDE